MKLRDFALLFRRKGYLCDGGWYLLIEDGYAERRVCRMNLHEEGRGRLDLHYYYLSPSIRTQIRDLARADSDQTIEIIQQRIQRQHIHHSQLRVRTPEHFPTPKDPHEPLVALFIHLKDHLRAQAGPDHHVDLQDRE